MQSDKEKAIIKQTNEFLDSKCKDLSRQLDETKKLYDETLKALETTANVERYDLSKQLQEMREMHQKELDSLD